MTLVKVPSLYTKQSGNLASLIDQADDMSADEISSLGEKSSQRIAEAYSWQYISDKYGQVFLGVSE